MEHKTKIKAEESQPSIIITREFELPVDLLFRAHTEAGLFEQWMSHEYGSTKVVKMESRPHGGWRFETRDPGGNVLFAANGVFHDFVPGQKIIRTFEMENTPFDVQLDFINFEELGEDSSRLTIHSIYRTLELRDQLLKLPFAEGLGMAHDRLQKVIGTLN